MGLRVIAQWLLHNAHAKTKNDDNNDNKRNWHCLCSTSKQADKSNSYLSQGKEQQRLNPTKKKQYLSKKENNGKRSIKRAHPMAKKTLIGASFAKLIQTMFTESCFFFFF